MTQQTQSPAPATAASADPIWFASYPPGIPKSIDPDAYPSLSAMLLDACTRHAAHAAFECLGARMSYAEWERVSRAFAAFLVEEVNCKAGDRVAIMLPNLLAYPVAFLGALRAGLTVVNVNPLYTPRELKEQLADAGATVIVIMENFAHKLEPVLAETRIRHVVVARLGDFMPALKRTVFNFANTYIRRAVPAWRFKTFTMLQAACGGQPTARVCGCAAALIVARLVAIYRRHYRRPEGSDPHAPQSGREHAAVPRRDQAVSERRAGDRSDAAAALSHLFADGEPACVCVDGRTERAGTGSARHQGTDPHHAAGTGHDDDRRQYAVQCADQFAGFRRTRFQQAQLCRRRRRGGAKRGGGTLARDHRHRAGGRLRAY